MLIGITGQIGSGKSTAARYLEKLGAVLVDADEIGRAVVENDDEVLGALVEAFGGSILTRDATLDRAGLARLAFASETNLETLNAIVHPSLLAELHRQAEAALLAGEIVVIDAALLLDWGLDEDCDLTMFVYATKEDQLRWLVARGIVELDARNRLRRQLPDSEFRSRCDIELQNTTSPEALYRSLDRLWSTHIARS